PARLLQLIQEEFEVVKKRDNKEAKETTLENDFARKFPLKILIAEDNVVNRTLAKLILNKLGYEPEHADNGLEALTMVKENHYQLILMDVQMPEMDGLEAT